MQVLLRIGTNIPIPNIGGISIYTLPKPSKLIIFTLLCGVVIGTYLKSRRTPIRTNIFGNTASPSIYSFSIPQKICLINKGSHKFLYSLGNILQDTFLLHNQVIHMVLFHVKFSHKRCIYLIDLMYTSRRIKTGFRNIKSSHHST